MRTASLWMLDVDGPLIEPVSRAAPPDGLLDQLLDHLRDGGWLSLNTGRPVAWASAAVLTPIAGRAQQRGLDLAPLLDRVAVVGEKGASMTVHRDGDSVTREIRSLAVPPALRANLADLASRFADAMFVDGDKRAMFTAEMAHGQTLATYAPRQREFVAAARQLVADAGRADRLRVDATTIAVDVEDRRLGKGLGADRTLDWMAGQGVVPSRVLCAGDSRSDLEMADRVSERLGSAVDLTFINVGAAAVLDDVGERSYTVVQALRGPGDRAAAYVVGTEATLRRERHTAALTGRRQLSAPDTGLAV